MRAIKMTYRSFGPGQDTEPQFSSSGLGQRIQQFWIIRRRCNFEFSILALCTTSKELMSVLWLVGLGFFGVFVLVWVFSPGKGGGGGRGLGCLFDLLFYWERGGGKET